MVNPVKRKGSKEKELVFPGENIEKVIKQMKIGKKEREQVKLVEDWNSKHSVGIEVIVTKDDKTERRTKTRSAALMLGASGEYPGHTAVIWVDGVPGCYALERARAADVKA